MVEEAPTRGVRVGIRAGVAQEGDQPLGGRVAA